MLTYLKSHLKGKVVVLGIGNTMRSDDGVGSILANRIKDKVHFAVFDAGTSPENYLGKIIQEEPDTVLIIDAVDSGLKPGDFNLWEGEAVKTANLFSTHNASLSLTINYLQSHLKADIIILVIQPKSISLGDELSPEMTKTLDKIEAWFYDWNQKER